MVVDLLERRKDKFVIWIPGFVAGRAVPELLLGTRDIDSPGSFKQLFSGMLSSSEFPDLFELDPNVIRPSLQDGTVYYYWFIIQDTSPENLGLVEITDPIAYTVDYTVTQSAGTHVQPAGVIKFRDNKLWPCDVDGNEAGQPSIPTQDSIPDNNHLVIYELPTSWAKYSTVGDVQKDIGTFADVLALFDQSTPGDRFRDVAVVSHEAIVAELGINALELLPAADANPTGEWGYATANYFAPDFDLGSASSLVKLSEYIQSRSIRLFTDVVMAFGHDPYIYASFNQFHIEPTAEPNNPDSYQSHTSQLRDGYGGRSWRYLKTTNSYNPVSGKQDDVHPAWSIHLSHLHRWMTSFGVGGLRLDSINNIASYDFVKAYKEYAWSLYSARYTSPSTAKFLVIGEELSDPMDLLTSGTLNALWNEPFQGRLRSLLLGETSGNDNFEWTVRKMVNCTLDTDHPFTDGAQAINYITSHDTEGYRKERLFNFLSSNGITDIERRAKFAFALFLIAVGIPMIFAGEEFCDQMDRDTADKQVDPVNYERKSEPWRSAVFDYVSTLVNLRKNCPALGVDDTNFIHVDESRGGKIMAWTRGEVGMAPVVVVANFTDEDTPGGEYVVENFPEVGRGDWKEVTQGRNVPQEWVGREPLMKWEVKVYTYWSG